MGSSAKSSSLQTINHDEIRRCCSLLPWQLMLMLMHLPMLTTPMATAMATILAATTATLLWLLSPVCPPSMEVLCMVSPRSPTVSMATTMARGLLMPSPLLSLPLKPMPMPSTTMAMPTTDTVSTMATLLPTMDTMDTSATTDIPTCTTATTDTITNLLIFVKN